MYDLMGKSMNDSKVLIKGNTDKSNVSEPIDKTDYQSNKRFKTLIELVDRLPEIDKQAIYLFYLEEMKISSTLRIPEGTVKSRLNRSRIKLREQANNSHRGARTSYFRSE